MPCVVCQQTQQRRLLIEGDLRSGLTPVVISMRYHLAVKAIAVHHKVA